MCRHCEYLQEDQQIVHQFMALAARRLSEKHARLITADEVDIQIVIDDPEAAREPIVPVDTMARARRLLADMAAEGSDDDRPN